jgi:hypothetical protein
VFPVSKGYMPSTAGSTSRKEVSGPGRVTSSKVEMVCASVEAEPMVSMDNARIRGNLYCINKILTTLYAAIRQEGKDKEMKIMILTDQVSGFLSSLLFPKATDSI